MRDIVITSSILILAIFIIRYLAKGKIHPVLQYALWLPVVIRLMMPIPLWNSHFSILNYLPEGLLQQETAEAREYQTGTDADSSMPYQAGADADNSMPYQAGVGTDTGISNTAGNVQKVPALTDDTETGVFSQTVNGVQNINGILDENSYWSENAISGENSNSMHRRSVFLNSLHNILFVFWIAGMVLTGGYMFFYQCKWKKYLHRNRKPLNGMESYQGLSVYTVKGLPSPCLSGRCIYLTKEMAADEKRLKHILVHEYCHYKHGDSLWVIVRCLLTIIYWFHPLVWAAAYASKQDSELACDEASIRLLGEEERIAYGRTLLRLITGEVQERNRMGFASTMSGEEKGIRERIYQIARKRKYAALAAGCVILLAAVLVFITFSGSRQGDSTSQAADSSVLEGDAVTDGENLTQTQETSAKAEGPENSQQAAEAKEQELRKELDELAGSGADREAGSEVDSAAILKRLAAYDEKIVVLGSQGNVYGIQEAKDQSSYVQAYYENGENALEEGIYQLEKVKGSDGSDITIYGMYTKEYGCRGIKILIGNDVNDFDEPWLVSGMHGREENIRVYESAQDGMPRTFAYRMIAENTSDTEVWDFYLCDRYDTGTIDLYQFEAQDYMEQINSRLRLEIEASGDKMPVIAVYDNGNRIGEIEIPVSETAAEEIKDVVLNDSAVSFELGMQENELKLLTAVGIRFNKTDEIWYDRLPIISFPITCGSMGEREFHLGEASIESKLIAQTLQSRDSIDELCGLPLADSIDKAKDTENALLQAFSTEEGHYDVEVVYTNPCPSYTRISDAFGERTHPVTQERKMHNGVDLAAEAGADIVAAADGTVYQTGYDAASGNYVILYHVMNGEFTYYTACQDILVAEGESVTAGERIATVGSTGRSTGAHLHFAVSRDGEYVEPVFE